MALRQFVLSILFSSLVVSQSQGPRVSVSSQQQRGPLLYDWHLGVTATIFWIGEKPTARNPTPNNKSSWDTKWQINYGGYDNPDPKARRGFLPKAFTPKLNPFYIALPYNDVLDHRTHKPEASRVIPWFKAYNPRPGQSVCRGRWVQLVRNGKICYAQWEDCGPWVTNDWEYVFKNKAPKNRENGGAGIDISPAVRDYFGLKSGQKVHWRFVELSQVPPGPWRTYGANNPFVSKEALLAHTTNPKQREYLKRQQRLR